MESILAVIGSIFLPLITVILIVWFNNNEKRKRYQFQADLYAKVIEQGKPIPTGFFSDAQKRHYSLNAGLVCMAAGVGVALSVWLMSVVSQPNIPSDNPMMEFWGPMAEMSLKFASRKILAFASLGIIPFLIGVAFIIIHFIEKGQVNNENAQ